jgi:predicted ATPase
MRGDTERVLRCCDEAQKIVDEEGLGDFAQHVLVNNWRGRTHTRMGDYEAGYRLTKLATTRWREAEGRICSALFWGSEAIALGGLGRTREALELIDAAIAHCRDTGDRFMEPEVLRVKAELMLATDESDSDAAEAILLEALQIARDHRANSWELRAATSLAKLMCAQDRQSKARALLAPVYDWFTEGFDTADLREAKVLLEKLS